MDIITGVADAASELKQDNARPTNPAVNAQGEIKSRVTVVETIYFQRYQEEPVSAESKFARWVDTDEQPYNRRLKVGPNWQKLDKGWLEEVGVLWIENTLPKYSTMPTLEERLADAAKVLEIGILTDSTPQVQDTTQLGRTKLDTPIPIWLVPPGEAFRGQPVAIDRLWLRCPNGLISCLLWLYPL